MPPPGNGLGSKLRGIGVCSHIHIPAIELQLINAVGYGHAIGLRTKIMVIHQRGLALPTAPGVLKLTHQLFLLGIHADNRLTLAGIAFALASDVLKLLVIQRRKHCHHYHLSHSGLARFNGLIFEDETMIPSRNGM